MKLTGLIPKLGFAPQENTLGFYALQNYAGNPSAYCECEIRNKSRSEGASLGRFAIQDLPIWEIKDFPELTNLRFASSSAFQLDEEPTMTYVNSEYNYKYKLSVYFVYFV